MNRRLSALLATSGAVALTFALSTPPTLATTIDSTYTTTPGGTITATAGRTTLTDGRSAAVIACASSSVSITLPGDGIPHAGSGFGKITAFSFSGCTLGTTIAYTVTTNALPWGLNIASFNTVHNVVHGSITGINMTLAGAGGCTAVVDGTAAGAHNGYVKWEYGNEDGKLTTVKANGKLVLYDTAGCGTLFVSNDPVALVGVYTLSPPQDIT